MPDHLEAFHVVLVHDGETNEEALAMYAQQRGIAVAEVCDPEIYLTSVDAAL